MSERLESEAAGEGAEEGTELRGELCACVVAVVSQSMWAESGKRKGGVGLVVVRRPCAARADSAKVNDERMRVQETA